MLSFLSFVGPAWEWLKTNKQFTIPAAILLLLVGTHWFVYRKGYAASDVDWRARIAAAPTATNITYPKEPVKIAPSIGTRKPVIKTDGGIFTEVPLGGDVGSPAKPDSVEYVGNLVVSAADTNLSWTTSYLLKVFTTDASSITGTRLEFGSLEIPIKRVQVDHYILEPRPWYETWEIILAGIAGLLFGHWLL